MNKMEIILETADQLSNDYSCWTGELNDFVRASSIVSNILTTKDVKNFHKEFMGSSFNTEKSIITLYDLGNVKKVSVNRKT